MQTETDVKNKAVPSPRREQSPQDYLRSKGWVQSAGQWQDPTTGGQGRYVNQGVQIKRGPADKAFELKQWVEPTAAQYLELEAAVQVQRERDRQAA